MFQVRLFLSPVSAAPVTKGATNSFHQKFSSGEGGVWSATTGGGKTGPPSGPPDRTMCVPTRVRASDRPKYRKVCDRAMILSPFIVSCCLGLEENSGFR